MDIQVKTTRFLGKIYRIYLPFLVLLLLIACVPQSAASTDGSTTPVTTDSPAASIQSKDQPKQPQGGQALMILPVTSAGLKILQPQIENVDYQIELVDALTGEPVEGTQPVELGREVSYAFSPDRSQLAVVSKGADCSRWCLQIFKLANLNQTVKIDVPDLGSQGYVNQMKFDLSGTQIVISYSEYNTSRLTFVDISRPESPDLRTIDFPYVPSRLAFSDDGAVLIMVAHELQENLSTPAVLTPRLHALSLDAETLRLTWDQELADVNDGFYGAQDHSKLEETAYYQAGIAVDSGNQKIYIAHADADKLTTVDFAKQSVKTVTIREEKAWLDGLIESILSIGVREVQAKAGNTYSRQALLSADGRTLYVIGSHDNMTRKSDEEWEFNHTPLGLAVWDVTSGTTLLQVSTDASEIRQGPDGVFILDGYIDGPVYHPFTEIFDPATGEVSARLERAYVYPSLRTDGEAILVSSFYDDSGNSALSILDDNAQKPEILWQRSKINGYAFFPEFR